MLHYSIPVLSHDSLKILRNGGYVAATHEGGHAALTYALLNQLTEYTIEHGVLSASGLANCGSTNAYLDAVIDAAGCAATKYLDVGYANDKGMNALWGTTDCKSIISNLGIFHYHPNRQSKIVSKVLNISYGLFRDYANERAFRKLCKRHNQATNYPTYDEWQTVFKGKPGGFLEQKALKLMEGIENSGGGWF